MSDQVQEMFKDIAPGYDRANDVLSLGLHKAWRRQALRFVALQPRGPVLDLCCGTGDFALAMKDLFVEDLNVVGIDFVDRMLGLAQEKFEQRGVNSNRVHFIQGDATKIPFQDQTFELVTLGFGIRNTDSPEECLQDVRRVLMPGGRALILEFGGAPSKPILADAYRMYTRYVMPVIGQLLTGNRSAYEYLPETSMAFPYGREFLDIMESQSFIDLRHRSVLGGVAHIYVGTKQ